jgi:hypothetical protein
MSYGLHEERQDLAYKHCPFGSWKERWIPGVCKHDESEVRCTHGDEIIARGWRRRACLRCGRSLRGPLPKGCFFTGKTHTSWDAAT